MHRRAQDVIVFSLADSQGRSRLEGESSERDQKGGIPGVADH